MDRCICGKENGGHSFYWAGKLYCSMQCAKDGILQDHLEWAKLREKRIKMEDTSKAFFDVMAKAGFDPFEDNLVFGKMWTTTEQKEDARVVTVHFQVKKVPK